MKDIEYVPTLPLIEVEEIFEDQIYKPINQWEQKLNESINTKGYAQSFDERVKIVDKIDVWSINIK